MNPHGNINGTRKDMKKVIYSVLVGNYDKLRQPEVIVPGWDYICFSNDLLEKQIGVWQIRRFDYHNKLPVRESHYPKMNPHLVLPEYECSLYLDAKVAFREALADRLPELANGPTVLAMIPHPERNCVYQEAMLLTAWGIGEPDLIYQQARYLLSRRFPASSGLYDTAVIFRRHLRPEIIEFSRIWWDFYDAFSSRDQMAVSWALHQAGLKPDVLLPSSFFVDNLYPHEAKRRYPNSFSGWELLRYYFAILRIRLLFYRYGIKIYRWPGEKKAR